MTKEIALQGGEAGKEGGEGERAGGREGAPFPLMKSLQHIHCHKSYGTVALKNGCKEKAYRPYISCVQRQACTKLLLARPKIKVVTLYLKVLIISIS